MPRGKSKNSKRSKSKTSGKRGKSSKGKRKGKGRSKAKSTGRKSSNKALEYISSMSPYNVVEVGAPSMSKPGSHLKKSMATDNLMLFGSYTPDSPLSSYSNPLFPFSPNQGKTTDLNKMLKPLANISSDEPFLNKLLDLNRQTEELASIGDDPSAKKIEVVDTLSPPYLSQTGGFNDMLPNLGMMQAMGGIPVSYQPRKQKNLKTLDEITYTAKVTPENKNYILNTQNIAVTDKELGIDPTKDYLIAK